MRVKLLWSPVFSFVDDVVSLYKCFDGAFIVGYLYNEICICFNNRFYKCWVHWMVMKKKWNKFAIAGFVLSFFGGLAVLGIIFCIVALVKLKNNKKMRGKGLAIAGIIIGILVCVITTLQIIYYM